MCDALQLSHSHQHFYPKAASKQQQNHLVQLLRATETGTKLQNLTTVADLYLRFLCCRFPVTLLRQVRSLFPDLPLTMCINWDCLSGHCLLPWLTLFPGRKISPQIELLVVIWYTMEIDAILFYLFWFPWTQSFIETGEMFFTHSDWLFNRIFRVKGIVKRKSRLTLHGRRNFSS